MYKKTRVILAIFLSLSLAGSAQFHKGERMAGASVASVVYNNGNADVTVTSIGDNTSKNTNFNFSITPSMAWFLSEHTAVGGIVNINPNGSTVSYGQNGSTYQKDKQNAFNVGIGGFVRHYFGGSSSWLPFVQPGFNVGISNLKTDGFYYYTSGTPYYKTTYSGKSTGGFFANGTLTAGLTKKLSELIGLDLYLGYTYSYSKNTFKKTTLYYLTNTSSPSSTGTSEVTTKFTNHGFMLGIGFQVFLKGNNAK